MSPREGINLLCTNRGLISPLRVCVRVCVRVRVSAGGVAPAQNAQVKMTEVRVRERVSEGGVA